LKGTVHDLKEEIAVSIAAALQAERERTRAEDREACAKVAFDAVMALSNKRHHSRLQIGAVAAASIRALEAAQLPQGKDK
jgi:hypothetical protein